MHSPSLLVKPQILLLHCFIFFVCLFERRFFLRSSLREKERDVF
jgi:hypothetical protein